MCRQGEGDQNLEKFMDILYRLSPATEAVVDNFIRLTPPYITITTSYFIVAQGGCMKIGLNHEERWEGSFYLIMLQSLGCLNLEPHVTFPVKVLADDD